MDLKKVAVYACALNSVVAFGLLADSVLSGFWEMSLVRLVFFAAAAALVGFASLSMIREALGEEPRKLHPHWQEKEILGLTVLKLAGAGAAAGASAVEVLWALTQENILLAAAAAALGALGAVGACLVAWKWAAYAYERRKLAGRKRVRPRPAARPPVEKTGARGSKSRARERRSRRNLL